MYLDSLSVLCFRNFNSLKVNFSKNINLFIGRNGAGKTSLLEAIYYLSLARSFRTSKNNNIVTFNENKFSLFSELSDNKLNCIAECKANHKLGILRNTAGDIKVRYDDENLTKVSDLANILMIQLIEPKSMNLVSGGPSFRRQFLDWGCFYHFPDSRGVYREFSRILKQRNILLQQKSNIEYIKYWTDLFISYSQKISEYRKEYLSILNESLDSILSIFFNSSKIEIVLKEQVVSQDNLENTINKELILGTSLFGAQKTDLRIKINNKNVEDVLSRGQQKLLVVALKIAQGEILSKKINDNVIFLIDDIWSELDVENLKKVLSLIQNKNNINQYFITSINQIPEFNELTYKKYVIEDNDIVEIV